MIVEIIEDLYQIAWRYYLMVYMFSDTISLGVALVAFIYAEMLPKVKLLATRDLRF